MKILLSNARHEILDLRRRTELMEAQLAIVDVFAAALGLKRRERGMTPDIVQALEKRIEELVETGA